MSARKTKRQSGAYYRKRNELKEREKKELSGTLTKFFKVPNPTDHVECASSSLENILEKGNNDEKCLEAEEENENLEAEEQIENSDVEEVIEKSKIEDVLEKSD